MERKLAAILAADVVGYSALMERDEAGTFERLTAIRKELSEAFAALRVDLSLADIAAIEAAIPRDAA